jgi:hypothetical protein
VAENEEIITEKTPRIGSASPDPPTEVEDSEQN